MWVLGPHCGGTEQHGERLYQSTHIGARCKNQALLTCEPFRLIVLGLGGQLKL